jgi:hypothetical protein
MTDSEKKPKTARRKLLQVAALSTGTALASTLLAACPEAMGVTDTAIEMDAVGRAAQDAGPGDASDDAAQGDVAVVDAGTTVQDAGAD